MSTNGLVAECDDFLFTPQSPLPIGLFRILYGLCVTATLLLLRPDWLAWYGPHAWVTSIAMAKIEPGVRLNLFNVIPQEASWAGAGILPPSH